VIARAAGGLFTDGTSADYGQPDAAEAARRFEEFPWTAQVLEWKTSQARAPLAPSVTFRNDDGHLDIQASETDGRFDVEIALRRPGRVLGLFAGHAFDTGRALEAERVRQVIATFVSDLDPAAKRESLRPLVAGGPIS